MTSKDESKTMEEMSDKLKLYMIDLVVERLQHRVAFPEELREFLIDYDGSWDGNSH